MMTKEILQQIQTHNPCNLLKGTETISELIELIYTPQGIEFCTQNSFPTLSIFKSLEQSILTKSNVLVDAGDIELSNPKRVFLVGDTNAVLTYDDPSQLHYVVLMHGASATIKASGYAVVVLKNSGGSVKTEVTDNAIIL